MLLVRADTSSVPLSAYLVFDHSAEVVIPEKDTELALLNRGRELT